MGVWECVGCRCVAVITRVPGAEGLHGAGAPHVTLLPTFSNG